MYALAMVNRSHVDPVAVKTMLRAAVFLRKNYIAEGVLPGQLAVWSAPVSERSRTAFPTAELGATGLGLVALSAVDEAEPGTIPVSELQALGRFIVFLQREDGSFVSKYVAGKGPVTNWESLYYPGEAALGLISLYKVDHSREGNNYLDSPITFGYIGACKGGRNERTREPSTSYPLLRGHG
jgi:hypothetical protein